MNLSHSIRVFGIASIVVGAILFSFAVLGSKSSATSAWLGLDFYTQYIGGGLLIEGASPYVSDSIDSVAYSLELPRIKGDIPGSLPGWLLLLHTTPSAGSPGIAFAVWAIVGWLCYCLGILVTWHGFVKRSSSGRSASVVLYLWLFFPPAIGAAFIGQPSLIVSLAMVTTILCIGPAWMRGGLLGLAGSAKVFPFALMVVFFQRRDWASIKWVCLVAGLLQVPALILRPTSIAEFLAAAGPVSTSIVNRNAYVYANQSLRGVVLRVLADLDCMEFASSAYLLSLILVLGSVAVLWYYLSVRHSRLRGEDAAIAFAIMAMLCTPFFWHHSYVVLAPVYMLSVLQRPMLGWTCVVLLCLQFALDHNPVAFSGFGLMIPISSPAFFSICIIVFAILRGTLSLSPPIKKAPPSATR
ncbi:DUF2029 domain-containing protein [Myxococcota bacterium]|nr:DUF2029 domain-containing protein [Myxococcota bacterium]